MNYWLVPCNVRVFDIVRHFEKKDVAFFKKNRALSVGDIVYIYVAKPYSAVKYKGVVIKSVVSPDDIPQEYHPSRLDINTYVEIRKVLVFPDNVFSRVDLMQNGIGQLVNQQCISGKTKDYFLSIEEKIREVMTDA